MLHVSSPSPVSTAGGIGTSAAPGFSFFDGAGSLTPLGAFAFPGGGTGSPAIATTGASNTASAIRVVFMGFPDRQYRSSASGRGVPVAATAIGTCLLAAGS